MIYWMDFILDDVVGPILSFDETSRETSCRVKRGEEGGPSIRKDTGKFQETRSEQRSARMVDRSSQENLDSVAEDMDVDRTDPSIHSVSLKQGLLRGDA